VISSWTGIGASPGNMMSLPSAIRINFAVHRIIYKSTMEYADEVADKGSARGNSQ
jgi:hypothetical protein